METPRIESQNEISLNRQIADVRPWGERAQEWLSHPVNFLFLGVPLLGLAIVVPVTMPICVLLYLIAHLSVMGIKMYLPYRYPAHAGKGGDGKPGEGIMMVGAVRAKSPLEAFKQCWLSDDDLRKHWLIMGSTGSGKSEALKGIFYNALCWGSGFFCADGKADNKLPIEGFTMALAFARDDDILSLNFLLGGKTPQQVARSRRRRSNGLNPFSGSDADTLIQMGANLLPKAEGDGKSWQEKALAVWRAVVTALCYKRDTQDMPLSVATIIDYLALPKIEELYIEGYKEAQENAEGSWSYGFTGIKAYLESGCPAYQVEKLLKKHGLADGGMAQMPGMGGRRPGGGRETEQDPASYEQHGYRVGQLMPVLTLLDKTYGYIFRAPFSEIDMIDVALHNRILFLLIPSLEKSSQEAENLGKLAIACLRVMMARNLGADTEGTAEELIDSKATAAPYPYIVALDELGYYFSDGIAVMFAQARSLGISMIAAAQDLEKLTEGSRQAEAGAMIGNTVNKIFMKIDDAGKTLKLVQDTVGKASVATFGGYESQGGGFKRNDNVGVSERDKVTYQELQSYKPGQALVNTLGNTQRVATFYMGDWLRKLNNRSTHINRFMQIYPPTPDEIERNTVSVATAKDVQKIAAGTHLMRVLKGDLPVPPPAPNLPVFMELSRLIRELNAQASGIAPVERGIVLYLGLKAWLARGANTSSVAQTEEGIALPAEDVPASAELLLQAESSGLAQALDEHGLPDPLALIRKPVRSILAPNGEEMPIRRRPAVLTEPTDVGGDMPFDFGVSDLSEDSIDDILTQGRNPSRVAAPPAQWVNKAVAQAHDMAIHPRSADDSAVGLSDETLEGLAELEKELGSAAPRTAAQTMQKVVAAQNTPETVGKGTMLSDEEIEDYFKDLGGGDE